MQHLLANDLTELVHIFKENVVVRHSPTPAGGENIPKICVPDLIMLLHREHEGHKQLTFRQK